MKTWKSIVGLSGLLLTLQMAPVLKPIYAAELTVKGQFSDVESDLHELGIVVSESVEEWSLLTYLRSDEFNYFYLIAPSREEKPEKISVTISTSTEWMEDLNQYEEAYETYELTVADSAVINGVSLYKTLLKEESILEALRVNVNDLQIEYKNDSVFSYVGDVYCFEGKKDKKPVKRIQEATVRIENNFVYTRSFEEYSDSVLLWDWDSLVQEYSNLSYYLFDTSNQDFIDNITGMSIEYEYYEWQCYYPYTVIASEVSKVLAQPVESIRSDSNVKDFVQTAEVTVSVDLLEGQTIEVVKTGFFRRPVYKFDRLFSKEEVKGDQTLLNKMGDRQFGCLFDYSPRKATKYEGDGSGAGGGGGSGTRPLRNIITVPIVTGSSYILSGREVTQANVLSIDYVYEGKKYSVEAIENWTENTDYVVDDGSGKEPDHDEFLKTIQDFLDGIVDFFKNIANMGRIVAMVIVAIIAMWLIVVLFKKRN